MNRDNDIAALLPDPPPPAPARAAAAIDAALRKFDGQEAVAPPAPVKRRAPLWSPAPLGLAVSAMLVALIALPRPWVSPPPAPDRAVERPRKPPSQSASAPVTTSDTPAPTPPGIVAAEPASAPQVASPQANTAPSGMVAPAPSEAYAPPPPPAAPPPAVDTVVIAERRAEQFASRTDAEKPALARAPEAVGAAAPMRDDADNSSIVVTGARRSRQTPRGGWNACTVNDPARNLRGCRMLLAPSRKGVAGQADAQVADGLTQAWQGETARAIAAFDQAIALNPRLSIAYLNRGLAYEKQGDPDRALTDFDAAVRYAPNAARGYYNRSLLLRQRGDIRRARADERRAVDLDAGYADALR